MAETAPEKKIRCPACEKLFPVSKLRKHQLECPEIARLDGELVLPGRNLRK